MREKTGSITPLARARGKGMGKATKRKLGRRYSNEAGGNSKRTRGIVIHWHIITLLSFLCTTRSWSVLFIILG